MLSALGRRTWLGVLATASLFGVSFVLAMLLNWLGSGPWSEWRALIHVGVLFAVLGTLYGVVVALDAMSGMASMDSRPARTILCAVLGAVAVFVVWSWHPGSFNTAWVILGALAGATLGWFGWRWAKHVDF